MSDNGDQVNEPREEIAIVGMAGRFPGAKNIEEFWRNLREGVESIRTFSDEELRAAGVDDATFNDSSYVKAGAVLNDADAFDADFFGINPREAEIMDPQHRAMLECAWEALENAGYDPETFGGPIGVFGGVAPNTYYQNNLVARPDALKAVGHYPAMIATEKEYSITRISFKLNLKGPSIFLNTACSTSGVAIHIACQSVLSGECDMALAGGCRIKVPLNAGYQYQEDGILSPDGHCRAFDADARGTVVGSGVAMVVIKPLSDAIKHGDTIYAVIKGTTINNDGSAKVGFTAPSIQGQTALIEETLAIAEVSPETIGYVEAHGTGTSLGDPIEIAALTRAYRKNTQLKSYCAIGSVKTNIGHLDAAAGVVGVIKSAFSLKNRQIPPSLNFEKPNPQIDFANSPFYLNDKLSDWPGKAHPRRAAVSSFGLGGTNAHIILEEAPPSKANSSSRPWHLLVLSAKTDTALDHATTNLVEHFKNHSELKLSDAAYTLQLGRRAFNHRRSLVCRDIADAIAALDTIDPKRVSSRVQETAERTVAFMFSGQGSQYVHMGAELYQLEAIFREQVDTCAEILEPHLGLDIRQVLYPPAAKMDEASEQLNQTHITQSALFVIEYALAKLWMAWGVRPQAMIGHSIGEYVAACLAGVFSLQDALALVAARGRLMQQLPNGAMLAIPLPKEEVQAELGDRLSIAAINGPSLCVVSGPLEAVEALHGQYEAQEVECRLLHTSHAFHSAMMDPILEAFTDEVNKVKLHPPQIPYISNVSGTWITDAQASDAGYWAQHMRQTVQFSDGLQVLMQDSDGLLLEVGAGQTLSTIARRHPAKNKGQIVVSSLRHPKEQTPDLAFMLNSLGQLWLAGADIEWSQLYAGESRQRVPLPAYPFERKRFWIEAPQHRAGSDVDLSMEIGKGTNENEHLLAGDDTMVVSPSKPRKDRIIQELNSLIEDLSGLDPDDIDVHATFLELGFDSLLLTQANAAFKRKFEIKITFRQLFEETPTVNALAKYIDDQLPPEAFPDETPQIQSMPASQTAPLPLGDSVPGGFSSTYNQSDMGHVENKGANITPTLESLIAQQIQANNQLLEILKSRSKLPENLSLPSPHMEKQPQATTKKINFPSNWDLDFKAKLSELNRREGELDRELGIKRMEAYDGLERNLADLCSAYLCHYFESCGIEINQGSSYEASELQRNLKILPKFEKFFEYMLKILAEDRIIELDNNTITFLKDRTSLEDPQPLKDALIQQYPQFKGIVEMLDHCARQYQEALSGEMPAIQVLFPDGSRDLIKNKLEDNTIEHQRVRIYKLLAKELILELTAHSPVRILEVGAGSGSLTWQIAPALQGREVEYHFTDIGRSFVNTAKKEAARRGLGMMNFGVLDISQEPEKQGFAPESFDVVLALNVVHATPDIEATLGNLKKLLSPRGFICLVELVKAHRWTNLVWGTTEGWWYFNDRYRENTPLVEFDQWEKASQNNNFGLVHTLPSSEENRSKTDSGLIIAMRNEPSLPVKDDASTRGESKESVAEGVSSLGPWKPAQQRAGRMSDTQQQHLDALIKRFTSRTKESKRLTQAHRARLADPRTAAGFQLPWKELVYPIVAAKAYGSKLLDVDGNEWLDITMGFGVSLFGHSPAFIVKAIEKQLKNTMATGPQTDLAGKVADLICEFTGMERVAFCNTGSEAVLAAIRIARTVTGKKRIALFEGSYHGIFDEVLVKGVSSKGRRRSIPVASGIPRKAVEDVLVLDYGDFSSLDLIKDHSDELAAILVEPIQSRNPALQPREFLHALRELTEKLNIPLIFDEMITGFRINLGGAQAHFGVKADIAAYGKVVGGSMPIGVVGGKAEYLDALDGGMWNFGDDSVPEAGTTWFAGTFVRHPLSLAAAHAALRELKKGGPKLLEDVNQKTSRFADDFNHYFEQNRMPIHLPHFGTLFLIKFLENQPFSGLFWHYLRDKGIHCHEGRPNYFTTAHTDEDVSFIVTAFKEAAEEMRTAGFLPEFSAPASTEKRGVQQTEIREIPLTDAQTEIWLATCLGDEASCAFNVSTSIDLKGNLQVEFLQEAMNRVCNRHEALRTTISKDGDCQRIAGTGKIDVPFVDLTSLEPDRRDAEIAILQKKEVEEAFDLVDGPLFRARIIKTAQDHHLLVFTAHHIICDGWSLEIIIQDLSTFYSSSIGATNVEFKEAIQFSEFTALLRDQQDDTSEADTEAFWLEQFSDSVPASELPADRPRPPVKTYSCNQQSLVIDSTQFEELGRFATENGSTVFSILLAAYSVLIRRLTDQEDIVVGLAAGGQSSIGNKKLVGHCVNLLPIRNKIKADHKLSDYLSSVRSLLFDAFEYQHYSFGSLIKKLNLPRDVSRIPLISTIITYETAAKGIQFEGLDVSIEANLRNYCNFDLEFYLRESKDGLILRFDYNTDLFDDSTVCRWLENYQVLLKGLVVDPDVQIGQLPILPENELKQLKAWNDTYMAYPRDKCLHQLFEKQAEQSPDAVALVTETESLTYRELNNRANHVAQRMISLGVGPDIIVGVFLERSAGMITAILGILKAGGAYLPLDPEYPKDRLAFMLSDSQAQVLVTQNQLKSQLPEKCPEVLFLDTDLQDSDSDMIENPQSHVRSDNLAYLLYTSGSTGMPKGVAIEHHSPVALISWAHEVFTEKEMGGVLFSTSICFDLSVFEIFSPLTMGGKIILAENLLELPSLKAASEVMLINTVPSAIAELLRMDGVLPSVSTVNLAGELLKSSLVKKIYDVKSIKRVYDLYGPSEDTTYSTWVLRKSDGPRTIGRPISNTQAYVLDQRRQMVPIGVIGELYLGGDGLARGYLHRPDLTAEKFIENPFKGSDSPRLYATGDLVRYLPDGNLVYMGRIDHQVKIRGFRIELGEIEAVLTSHPSVKDQVVVAHELKPGDHRIIAYIVPKDREISIAELRTHLTKKLPNYMIPSNFVELDALPLTPNGKVDRKALPAPDNLRPEFIADCVEPRNETENVIAVTWKEVLNLKEVGVHDDFFELGGHSLLATQVLSRMNRFFQVNLQLHCIFEAPTIAQLAVVIEDILMEEIDTLTEEDAEKLLLKEEKEDA